MTKDYYSSEENYLLGIIFDTCFRKQLYNEGYSKNYYQKNKEKILEQKKDYNSTVVGKTVSKKSSY
jgi:hypothetical protein